MSFLSQSEAEKLTKVKERKRTYEDKQKKKQEEAEKAKQERLQAMEKAKKSSAEAAKKIRTDINKQYQETMKKQTPKTSAEALKNMKSDLGNLFNSIINPAQSELSAAWNKSGSKTLDAARKQVAGIYNSSIWGKTAEEQKGILGLSSGNALSNAAMLLAQQQLLTGKLTQTSIIDMIAGQIASKEKQEEMKKIATGALSFYDVQKTYISQYLINTFGNPEFLSNVNNIVYKNVTDYVNVWSTEMAAVGSKQLETYLSQFDKQTKEFTTQVDNFTKKFDSTFEKLEPKIKDVTKRITEKLDNVDKINILQSINDNITDLFSMKSIQNKLKSSPYGQFALPIVTTVGNLAGLKINKFLSTPKNIESVKKFSAKLKNFASKLTEAKNFVTSRLKMVKEFVNTLKEKAVAFVKEFATKIVADISSKISVNIAGVLGI